MAITELYMQTTGDNMNAGSTNADAASVTETNGSWDITADTFIATAATPFGGVNIGDWVSIYNDGVTSGAVYVAQVTAIYLSGLGVTLSTTAKYGTKPAAGATGKSAKVGGAWASMAIATSLFPSVAIPAPTRVNVKAGTYANTTTNRSIASAGTTAIPFIWRGYKTTIGDCDAAPTTTRVDGTDLPYITFTTGSFTIAGDFITFANISVTGARTAGAQVVLSGQSTRVHRSRFEATGANAAASAIQLNSSGHVFTDCWIKATTTATDVIDGGTRAFALTGCVIKGGGSHVQISSGRVIMSKCVLDTPGLYGFRTTGTITGLHIDNCTIIGATDGVRISTSPNNTATVIVTNTYFEGCTNAINNNTGGSIASMHFANNDFFNCTNTYLNFGDHFTAYNDQSESASALVSSTDRGILSTSNAKSMGGPKLFENVSYSGYLDIGAVQRQDPGMRPIPELYGQGGVVYAYG